MNQEESERRYCVRYRTLDGFDVWVLGFLERSVAQEEARSLERERRVAYICEIFEYDKGEEGRIPFDG